MKTNEQDPVAEYFEAWRAADDSTPAPALDTLLPSPDREVVPAQPKYTWMVAAALVLLCLGIGIARVQNTPMPQVGQAEELPVESLTITSWESPTDHLLDDL